MMGVSTGDRYAERDGYWIESAMQICGALGKVAGRLLTNLY